MPLSIIQCCLYVGRWLLLQLPSLRPLARCCWSCAFSGAGYVVRAGDAIVECRDNQSCISRECKVGGRWAITMLWQELISLFRSAYAGLLVRESKSWSRAEPVKSAAYRMVIEVQPGRISPWTTSATSASAIRTMQRRSPLSQVLRTQCRESRAQRDVPPGWSPHSV
jgi:hypothetical protein